MQAKIVGQAKDAGSPFAQYYDAAGTGKVDTSFQGTATAVTQCANGSFATVCPTQAPTLAPKSGLGIGVYVAIVVGALIVLASAVLLYRRRKSSQNTDYAVLYFVFKY